MISVNAYAYPRVRADTRVVWTPLNAVSRYSSNCGVNFMLSVIVFVWRLIIIIMCFWWCEVFFSEWQDIMDTESDITLKHEQNTGLLSRKH